MRAESRGARSDGGLARQGGQGSHLHRVHSAAAAVPISRTNVQEHTKLLQRETNPRKTPHEDCCDYCDRYCQDKITTSQRVDIDSWRQQVNTNMANNIKLTKKKPKQPKLRFLKPQTSATMFCVDEGYKMRTESGQRWPSSGISAVKQANRNGWTGGQVSVQVQSSSPEELHTHMASLSVQPSTSKWVDDHYGDSKSWAQNERADADTTESTGYTEDMLPNVSTPSSKVSSRTCSNELLNVITIDDAMRHQRQRILSRSPWSNAPQSVSRTRSGLTSPGWTRPSGYNVTPHSHAQPGIESVQEIDYPRESTYDEERVSKSQQTVVRAIDNVVATREVLNNKAHKGLFRYEKSYSHPTVTHESQRFQRMNSNLRKLMESQVLNNSPLSQRIQNYGTSKRSTTVTGHSTRSKQGQHYASQATSRGSNTVGSSLRNTKLGSPDTQFTTSRPVISTSGKENFLEMLMQLQELE